MISFTCTPFRHLFSRIRPKGRHTQLRVTKFHYVSMYLYSSNIMIGYDMVLCVLFNEIMMLTKVGF